MTTLTVARSPGTLSLIKVSVARARCSVTRARRSIFLDFTDFGRCLCGVQYALRAGSKAGTDQGSWMLGGCETQAVRAADIASKAPQPEAEHGLAGRVPGNVRCHLRAGTLDQRLVTRIARCRQSSPAMIPPGLT